jgi:hypothetical protein
MHLPLIDSGSRLRVGTSVGIPCGRLDSKQVHSTVQHYRQFAQGTCSRFRQCTSIKFRPETRAARPSSLFYSIDRPGTSLAAEKPARAPRGGLAAGGRFWYLTRIWALAGGQSPVPRGAVCLSGARWRYRQRVPGTFLAAGNGCGRGYRKRFPAPSGAMGRAASFVRAPGPPSDVRSGSDAARCY